MSHHNRSDGPDERCALEPIAICGMACRLPGGVDSASSLWNMLVEGRDGQTPRVPESRFNIDAYYHANNERPGSFNVMGGYFLDGDPSDFDPTAFGMTPIEAQWLDPQQRKVIEVVYECFESAGVPLSAVAGSRTAVFVGSFTSDYQQMSIRDPDFRHNYAATGVDPGIISNRVGNLFNLNGPSFTINTACSSSVYALHNACHALRAGDCDAAVVSGVNLVITVDQHMNTAKLGILSPTSFCHTFDASADGYGRAEGAGALYIKRLADAIRDGDVVRAIIRSSAVNTNGKVDGMGITHPSVAGQEKVVRLAYERAGLDPNKTAYAELHGTGTPVGDPIEVRAVSNALNDRRSTSKPLAVGAVKPNIGHSEAASGIFAIMKAAMMTETGLIPGVARFNTLNPAILEDEWNVRINRTLSHWPKGFASKRASVSSFGYGGTNGHVIVESVDAFHPSYFHGARKHCAVYDHSSSRPHLLCFSAHDKTTLQRNIDALQKVGDEYYIADLAYTLNLRRTNHSHRAFVVATEGDLSTALAEPTIKVVTAPKGQSDVGFIFTGQGAQYVGMGRKAMQYFPSMRNTLCQLDEVLKRLTPTPTFSLEGLIAEGIDEDRLNEAELAQPVTTALQIAIIDLLAEWNVRPTVSIGHSSGEIAAAYAAGLFSAPEAMLASFCRGRAVSQSSAPGTMLSVGLDVEGIQPYLTDVKSEVFIACENSPTSVTLSGSVDHIKSVQKVLEAQGIFARELPTGRAYHSPYMHAVGDAYERMLTSALQVLAKDDFDWRHRVGIMVSSVTEEVITDPGRVSSPSYWTDNLRNRVLFSSAVSKLREDDRFRNIKVMIEIGPRPALSGPFKQICIAKGMNQFTYTPSLVRNADDCTQLQSIAGTLFTNDYPVALGAVNAEPCKTNRLGAPLKMSAPSVLVDLPPYQWNYGKKYWAEARASDEIRRMKQPRHDLLGRRVAGLSSRSVVWRNILRHRDIPWLKDHTLGGMAVFPAAGFMSLGIEALRQLNESRDLAFTAVTLRDVDMSTALIVPTTDEGIEIQVTLTQRPGTVNVWYDFMVESTSDGVWTLHCGGKIAADHQSKPLPENDVSPVDQTNLTQRVPGKRWYDAFHRVGFQYGPHFQQLKEIQMNKTIRHASANVKIQQKADGFVDESRYIVHPSTVDACLQLIIISIHQGGHKEMPWGVIPIKIDQVDFWFPSEANTQANGTSVAWTSGSDGRYFDTHVKLFGADGALLVDVNNLRCVSYEAALPPSIGLQSDPEPFAETIWKPDIMSLTSDCASSAWAGTTFSATEAVARVVDLTNHRKPLRRVTVLGRFERATILTLLAILSPSCNIFVRCTMKEEAKILGDAFASTSNVAVDILQQSEAQVPEVIADEPQDLILIDSSVPFHSSIVETIAEEGWALQICEDALCAKACPGMHEVLSMKMSGSLHGSSHGWPAQKLTLSIRNQPTASAKSSTSAVTVFSANSTPSAKLLGSSMEYTNTKVSHKQFEEFNAQSDCTIIVDATEGLSLKDLSEQQINSVKAILTSTGSSVLWLTKGVNQGASVDGGMAAGFLRVLRSEQAASKILLMDINCGEDAKDIASAVSTLMQAFAVKDSGLDVEFWLRDGMLWIPRVFPNQRINALHSGSSTLSLQSLPRAVPLTSVQSEDGLVYERLDQAFANGPGCDQVRIQVEKRAGLSSAHIPVLLCGTVIARGDHVTQCAVGQKVLAFAQRNDTTIIDTSTFTCLDTVTNPDDLLANLPAIVTALYAGVKIGRIRGTDEVIILSGDPTTLAAFVGLARALKWKFRVLTTCAEQQDVLCSSHGLEQHSVTTKIPACYRESPSPLVVVATDFSSVAQETWRTLPRQSKFILCGADPETSPDPGPFARGVSFLSANVIHALTAGGPDAVDVLNNAMNIYRAYRGMLFKTDFVIRSESEPIRADAKASAVVKLCYDAEQVHVRSKVESRLRCDAEAIYLLVGCLGGLGRSLTALMYERGARHFAFLSRSGADKPEAATTVQKLLDRHCDVQIFRADASNELDVQRAVEEVQKCGRPIKGVVHAAMVLKDGIYSNMSFAEYQACVAPKVDGALNLHNALLGHDLDFFVMTSSISATLGNPGQANYAAANSFLDALAWMRNLNGFAATSLILPMVLDVGVVAENEATEQSLSRKGMYGIDEQEMLRGFEIAMLPRSTLAGRQHHSSTNGLGKTNPGASQLVLGLEPAMLAKAVAASDRTDVYWYNDARFCHVRAAVETAGEGSLNTASSGQSSFDGAIKAAQDEGPAAVVQTIAQHVAKRCGSILGLEVDAFELHGPSIASYGLDSMIGAEMRSWLFKEFGLDIPFQALLSSSLTFEALAKDIGVSKGYLKEDA